MKKLGLLILTLFLFTGCTIKTDSFEDIDIYTSIYPTEFITDYLYGEHSNIISIYPDGVNVDTYKLTNKQIKDYSNTDLFIFNGLDPNESEYVTKMFKYNQNLLIIDSSSTMEYNYSMKELWLDPSNFLMLALNIKNGILEYTTNHYLKSEIEENYNSLKIEISKIDANLKLINENASNNIIVVDDSSFKFLERYGFVVYSLQENDELTDKTILEVKNLITSGKVNYIFTTNQNELSETVQSIKNATGVAILELNTISNLTDEQRKNKENYISLLNDNIELLKQELYD